MIKKSLLIFLMVVLLSFLIFPQKILAETSEAHLPEWDTKILLNKISCELANYSRFQFETESKEEAAILIIHNAIVRQELSYWYGYLSKELLMTIPKAVLHLVSSKKVEAVVRTIELAKDINKARNILEDWLTENKIRIEIGTLDKEYGIWYILAYYPLDNENGEVIAVFYSPKVIELDPVRRGSYAPWTKEGKIDPFKLEIHGKVKRKRIIFWNSYTWVETTKTKGPIFNLSENIPEFPKSLEKPSFWQKVKDFFFQLIPFSQAQASQAIEGEEEALEEAPPEEEIVVGEEVEEMEEDLIKPNAPPSKPTVLTQFKSDGKTTIGIGNETCEPTVVFKAKIEDPDNDKVKLQIELRRLDEYEGKFDETKWGLKESSFVNSGIGASVTVYGLINGSYHWRARTIDNNGNISNWVDFGNNLLLDADFIVYIPEEVEEEEEEVVEEKELTKPLESPHPYANNYTNTWIISEPGVSQMRLHFKKVELDS
ncbi:MAG: hypothetical protein FJW63_09865, partial [Actinobacteria bacterium]|nr:hypothetical protein [Actinomycetota bacterium]